MNRANELRTALVKLGFTGEGLNRILRERLSRELFDCYCVMSDADRVRLWRIANLLARWPEAPEVWRADSTGTAHAMALPDPQGVIAVTG